MFLPRASEALACLDWQWPLWALGEEGVAHLRQAYSSAQLRPGTSERVRRVLSSRREESPDFIKRERLRFSERACSSESKRARSRAMRAESLSERLFVSLLSERVLRAELASSARTSRADSTAC